MAKWRKGVLKYKGPWLYARGNFIAEQCLGVIRQFYQTKFRKISNSNILLFTGHHFNEFEH